MLDNSASLACNCMLWFICDPVPDSHLHPPLHQFPSLSFQSQNHLLTLYLLSCFFIVFTVRFLGGQSILLHLMSYFSYLLWQLLISGLSGAQWKFFGQGLLFAARSRCLPTWTLLKELMPSAMFSFFAFGFQDVDTTHYFDFPPAGVISSLIRIFIT